MTGMYRTNEIVNCLSAVDEEIEELTTFFNSYTIERLQQKKMESYNASHICHNKKKENPTKYKIVEIFNKLDGNNISEIVEELQEFKTLTSEEFATMTQRIFMGLQNSNQLFRKWMGELCYKMKDFVVNVMTDFDKFNEVNVLMHILSQARQKYSDCILFESPSYNLNVGKQAMVLISSIYNAKLISDENMDGIFNDYVSVLNNELATTLMIENALLQFNTLLELIPRRDIKDYMLNYLKEKKGVISMQVRLTCENTFMV